jgi:hypothetical protein
MTPSPIAPHIAEGKCQRRDGGEFRILCTDRVDPIAPIIVAITKPDGNETLVSLCPDGKVLKDGKETEFDLVPLAPVAAEAGDWVAACAREAADFANYWHGAPFDSAEAIAAIIRKHAPQPPAPAASPKPVRETTATGAPLTRED